MRRRRRASRRDGRGAARRRVAVARRLLAAGRLCQLRMADVDAEDRFQWCVDNWEAVASRGRRGTEDQPPPGLDADELRVELLEAASEAGAVFASGEWIFRWSPWRCSAPVGHRRSLTLDAPAWPRGARWNATTPARDRRTGGLVGARGRPAPTGAQRRNARRPQCHDRPPATG